VDDRVLLGQVINDKDPRAFEILYSRYYQRLCGYVTRRLGATADAEDVTQSVFLRLWETRAGYDKGGSAEAYLLTVVYNTVTQNRRRPERRRQRIPLETIAESLVDMEPGDRHGASDTSVTYSLYDTLKERGARLSLKASEAIRLHFLAGLSPRQAASVAGCSLPAFYSRLERALRVLRQVQVPDEERE
jgi:RNA polymerase sigma factor (sigma-70 family)